MAPTGPLGVSPSTFQAPESFAKSFFGHFNNLFPADKIGPAAGPAGAHTFQVGSNRAGLQLTAEEIANVMGSKSGRHDLQALPENETFDQGGLYSTGTAVRGMSSSFSTVCNSFSPNDPMASARSHDSLSMSRQSVNAHPPYGHGPQQALPQSPYGPSPLPTADSMVIRDIEPSPRQPRTASRGSSAVMTPYGPAPDLGSFDVHSWTQEKEQHQSQMRQQMQKMQAQEQERLRHQQQKQQQPQMQQRNTSRSGLESGRRHQEQRHQHQLEHRHSSSSVDGEVADVLDQHVDYYLSQHPAIRHSHGITKTRPGYYEIRGREVMVDWEHNDPRGGDGFLIVIDGPLRQAFKDYVSGKDASAAYNDKGIRHSNLHSVPADSRMTFEDDGAKYNRLEAMKVAKEQAVFREKAAHCMNSGVEMHSDDRAGRVPLHSGCEKRDARLLAEYEKVIDGKLGNSRQAYENEKKRWSKKAQEEGIPKMYPEHSPPGLFESRAGGYMDRYGL